MFCQQNSQMVSFLLTITYNFHHNYPFSTNGENIFAWVQNMIIMIIFWIYGKNFQFFNFSNLWFLIYLIPQLWIIYSDSLPDQIYTTFIYLNIALSTTFHVANLIFKDFCSRIPQILEIIRRQSTGMNSIITVFLQFAGCAARVFTTLQEIGDYFILVR